MNFFRVLALVAFSLFTSAACNRIEGAPQPPVATSSAPSVSSPTKLRVALFPFVPADADGKQGLQRLREMLLDKFGRQHPEIELTLAEMDPNAAEFYDAAKLGAWLDQNTYDVIEIDAVMLGEISSKLAEWPDPRQTDWHPAAVNAVTLDGRKYGIPHLLCGYFLFSRNANVVAAKNVAQLVGSLQALAKGESVFGTRWGGTFNLPALFLDAFEDGHPGVPVDDQIGKSDFPDAKTLEGLRTLAGTCQVGLENPCLSGKYSKAKPAMDDFAAGKLGAYVGYSEHLHRILKQRTDAAPIGVTSAPLGAGSSPLLWTDMLVRPKKCVDACARAAQTFADFMDSPETMELLLMGDDLGGRIARYLLPATKSAFRAPRIAADSTYRQLEIAIAGAGSFPNHNFYNLVEDGKRSGQLLSALKSK